MNLKYHIEHIVDHIYNFVYWLERGKTPIQETRKVKPPICKKIGEFGLAEIIECQKGMSEYQKVVFMHQYNSVKIDRDFALILSILFGYLGIDRFFIEDVFAGLLKCLTLGLLGAWWIIDWFLIRGRVDEYNRERANEIKLAIKASN